MRVQKFDSTGAFVSIVGTSGSAEGSFNAPYGLMCDGSNNLFVVDSFNHRVQKFDLNGNIVH